MTVSETHETTMQKKISKEKGWKTLDIQSHELMSGSYWILGSITRVCRPNLGQRALMENKAFFTFLSPS